MGDLETTNQIAQDVLDNWPNIPEGIDALVAEMGGKKEAAMQRVLADCLRYMETGCIVVWPMAVCNEGLYRRWDWWETQGARKGTSDWVVTFPATNRCPLGFAVWLELKTATGRERTMQKVHRAALLAAGIPHYTPRALSVALGAIAEVWQRGQPRRRGNGNLQDDETVRSQNRRTATR